MWEESLRDILDNDCVEVGNLASILVDLFEGVVVPDIFLTHANKVAVQQIFSVRMGGSKKLGKLLCQPDIFCSMPALLQMGILDLLYVILRRGTYDVTRFQYRVVECEGDDVVDSDAMNEDNSQSISMNRVLLDLLQHFSSILSVSSSQQICEKIIRLLGVTFTAGCTPEDLKEMLYFLRTPTSLTLPLLQTMKSVMKQDISMTKASPSAFFNFGGYSSGIYSVFGPFPFTREYQFFTWFRIDKFENSHSARSMASSSADTEMHSGRQHIISVVDSSFNGIDVYIEQNVLTISVSDSKTPATLIRFGSKEVRFTRGVWYHIAVRHAKPRLSLFSKDEMSIYIDKILVFQDFVRFPNASNIGSTSLVCGRNFNGQIGPVYFLNESLPFSAVEAIARLDVGKSVVDTSSGTNEGYSAVIAADLLQSIATADRKVVNIAPKFSSVFHPARCKYGHALDVHSGRHAVLGPLTFTWIVHTARDVLEAMGGIACLLIMFPKLLIESENAVRYLGPDRFNRPENEPVSSQDKENTLNSILIDTVVNLNESFISNISEVDTNMMTLLDDSLLGVLEFEYDEASDSGCVGLLLSIIAHTLAGHRSYQKIIASKSAIEMIEFVMKAIPGEIMCGEGDGCILALLQLRSAVADYPALELRVTRRLICNFAAWTRCSFQFQSSLLSVVSTSIRAQPDYFSANLGVQGLLDILRVCFMDGADLNRPATPTSTKPVAVSYKTLLPLITSGTGECESPKSPGESTRGSFFSDVNSRGSETTLGGRTVSCTEFDTIDVAKRDSKGVMIRRQSLMDLLTFLNEGDLDPNNIENKDSQSVIKSPIKNDISKSAEYSVTSGGSLLKQVSFDDVLSECSEEVVKYDLIISDSTQEVTADSSNLQSTTPLKEEKKRASIREPDKTPTKSEKGTPTEPTGPLLDRHQRTYLRSSVLSMIMSLTQHFSTEREIRPLFQFISSCKDAVVTVEVAQLLLCLLVEGGAKVISVVTEVCGGPEEFAAFVIQKMIKSPSEDLRCLGLRLLTHFYLRIDLLPMSLLSLTLKRRKGSMLSRTMDKLSMMAGGVGMRRLQACGGFALLDEALSAHSETSSERTYATLLEMLLTKSSSKSPATVQYSNLSEEYATASASLHHLTGATSILGAGCVPNRMDSKIGGAAQRDRSVIFALSAEQVVEEGIDLTNAVALSFVLDCLPQLPVMVQGQIYRDILTILNRSTNNREVFRSNPSWHLSLFALTAQLMTVQPPLVLQRIAPSEVVKDICKAANRCGNWALNPQWGAPLSGQKDRDSGPNSELYRMKKKFTKLSVETNNLDVEGSVRTVFSPLSMPSPFPSEDLKDSWFLSAMEIYSNLLTRAMDSKAGWREVERTLSQSRPLSALSTAHMVPKYSEMIGTESQRNDDIITIQHEEDAREALNKELEGKGNSVARAVLSHLIAEMTVSIRAKYKDLQRLARSTRFKENQAGLDRMENILTLILSASQYFLADVCCASDGVGDLHIGRLRAHYYNEVIDEKAQFDQLVLESRASLRGFDADGMFSEEDPESPGDCSCIASTKSRRLEGGDRPFSPAGMGPGGLESPLSPTFSDDMADGKINASRSLNYYDLAEDRLVQRYSADSSSCSPGVEDFSPNSSALTDLVDYGRVWIALDPEGRPATTPGDSQSNLNEDRKATIDSKNSGPRSSMIGDLFNTLKRSQDPEEGRLGLVMQTLHLFDAIFWPHKTGALRNKHMLRFIKDQVQAAVPTASIRFPTQGVPFVQTDSASSSSAPSPLMRSDSIPFNTVETNIPLQGGSLSTPFIGGASGVSPKTASLPSPGNPVKAQAPSISLYTSVIRMSLSALQVLSPLSELASLNVRRLHELILAQDKVSPYTTPVDDWLLAAVLHVTVSLQRVVSSLFPIFLKMTLDSPLLSVPIMGQDATRESYDVAFQVDNMAFSAMEGDEHVMSVLEGLFGSIGGGHLMRYSRDCMHFLLSVVSTKRTLLEKALESRVCSALIRFAGRVAEDIVCTSPTPPGRFNAGGSKSNLEGNFNNTTAASASGSGAATPSIMEDFADTSVGLSDRPKRKSATMQSIGEAPRTPLIAPINRIKSWYLGGVSGKESPPPDSSYADHFSEKNERNSSPKNAKFANYTENEGEGGKESNGAEGGFARRKIRSESEGSDGDLMSESGHGSFTSSMHTAELQMLNQNYFSEADRHKSREQKEGDGDRDRDRDEARSETPFVDGRKPILRWLRLLRDPYLKMNALRSVGVVKSITALEYHEVACAKGFADELCALRGELEEHRDISKKAAEEMTELRELSSTIVSSLSSVEKVRQSGIRSTESMLLKKVAANWHECLSTFEMDWSPWPDHSGEGRRFETSNDDRKQGSAKGCKIDGVSLYEISELRDSRMRRMILTRAADPIDHRDSAYREGKQRGSWNKDNTFVPYRDHSASFTTQRASFLQLDLSKIRSIGGAAWGDDSDLPEGQGSVNEDPTPGTGPGHTREDLPPGPGLGLIGGLGALVFTSGTAERRPDCSYVFQWAPDERMHAMFTVTQVQLELMISGVLVLTNKTLYFHPNKIVGGLSTNKKPLSDHRWHIDRLLEAYGRRFLLQNCAIELFFADSPEVYFAFSTLTELQIFFRTLKRQNVPNLHASTSRSLDPRVVFSNSPWTDLWRRRLISNFEYLMRLNILAGRSYNDITQYPVFPWILADYTSETLDLNDPASFRDLSKPVGALNPVRLAEIKERYDSFDSDIMPPFMYGSHYSSAGVVIHYMMRQEPFTTMFVNLQGGKFDCPDRVFFDLKSTWECCNKDRSDVKELIPELFCCPESLLNTSNLPLGELQEGRGVVDDVLLPPWAQADAFEFVRLHREALESDYVSEHLHEWIDLIFGYKQTGPASVLAHNVFHYLSYENAIDIDAIEDPIDREAAKGHVTHFGQTPAQLTNKEHLPRLPREECMVPLCSDIYNISRLTLFTPPKQLDANNKHGAVISVRSSADRLIVVHADLSISYYRWSSFPDGEGSPFQLRPEKTKFLPSASIAKSEIELRRKSFVPMPPIDTNMQRCPQVSLISPKNSPSKGKIHHDKDTDITHITMDSVYGNSEELVGSNPSANSAKEFSSTNKSSWSFFGSLRRNTATPATPVNTPITPNSMKSKYENVHRNSPKSPHESAGSFDDCESDAEFEDDEDSMNQRYAGEEGEELETLHSTSSPIPMSPKRIAILKQLHLNSNDGTPVVSPSKLENIQIPSKSEKSRINDPKSNLEKRKIFGPALKKEKSTFMPLESSKLSEINCKNIALSVGDLGNGRVVSCGYWDSTLKVHALDSLKEIASINSGHLGEIVCVQLGYQGGSTLITGGADGTVRVWVLENPSLASSFSPDAQPLGSTSSNMNAPATHGISLANNTAKGASSGTAAPIIEPDNAHRNDTSSNTGPESPLVCAHVLCGHNSPVTAISYASDLDLAFSGSRSGLLCLHSVRKGKFIRSITHIVGAQVDLVLATSPGYLVAHTWSNQNMHVFWINGQHRATVRTATKVETMAVNGPANVLVCGHTDGRISLRAVWNLQQTHIVTHSSHGAIKCLWFTEVSIGTDPDVRWRLLHAAIQKTPLLGPTL